MSFRRSIRRWWRRHAQWALTDIRPWGRWEEMCVRTPACRFFNQTWNWRQARSLCYKAGGEDCHVMSKEGVCYSCLLYTSDAADDLLCVDLGGRRIIKKKKKKKYKQIL